jgi:uncharacterized Zn-binding protein involved in type VI secretion
MRKVIRLGDTTSEGGKVISSSAPHFTVGGIPVARVGDRCSCSLKGHSECTIIEGDPKHTINGVPVAYEGHRVSCGASLVSSTDLPVQAKAPKLQPA